MKPLISICCLLFLLCALHTSAQTRYAKNAMNVAVLVFNGVETLDFAGPGEVFSDASNDSGMLCKVYTVAPTADEVVSQGFLKIKPDYSIDNAPKPDIIVIPGGNSHEVMNNQPLLNWLKKYQNDQTYYMSVCTGAFILANTGMLDGKTATTHYCCQDQLAKEFPKVHVLKNERFIDNGHVITTEGISAGIDGSLYLVQKLFGNEVALDASKYMMYDWHPDQLHKVIN